MRNSIFNAYVLSLLLFCVRVQAAEIIGQVNDPAGASVASARITVVDAHSNKTAAVVITDPNGRFEVNGLPPGTYILRVESDSFETASIDVEVRQGVPMPPVSIRLKLKEFKQEVTVSGQPDSLTVLGEAAAQQKLETYPGNVSEVGAEQFRSSAVLSMKDALTLTPGIFAEQKEGKCASPSAALA